MNVSLRLLVLCTLLSLTSGCGKPEEDLDGGRGNYSAITSPVSGPYVLVYTPTPTPTGNSAAPLTVGTDILGVNLLYSDEKDAMWPVLSDPASTKKPLSVFDVGFMRFPGGEITSFWHWENPNGHPFLDSWDPAPVFPATPTPAPVNSMEWMSVYQYKKVLDHQGGKPLIGINLQSAHKYLPDACRSVSGDPTWASRNSTACTTSTGYPAWQSKLAQSKGEALRLVQWALRNNMPGATYFMDNEAYDQGVTKPMSSIEYAHYIKDYGFYLREARDPTTNAILGDKDANFVINWQNQTGGVSGILNIACRYVDYVDFHLYWHIGNNGKEDPDKFIVGPTFADWSANGAPMTQPNGIGNPETTYTDRIIDFRNTVARSTLALPNGCLNARGIRPKLGVFEWNVGRTVVDRYYWTDATKTAKRRVILSPRPVPPSRVQGALMAGEMLMQFMNAGLDAAAFFNAHFEPRAPEKASDPLPMDEGYRGLLTPGTLNTTPHHRVFTLFKSALGDQVLKTDSANATGIQTVVTQRTGSDSLTLFVLDKKPGTHTERSITIALPGFVNIQSNYSVKIQSFRGLNGNSYDTYAEVLETLPHYLDRGTGRLTITVGKFSITKIIIKRLQAVVANQIPVFIVAGQSNAVGPEDLTGSFAAGSANDSRVFFSFQQDPYNTTVFTDAFKPLALQNIEGVLRGGPEIALARTHLGELDAVIPGQVARVAVIKFAKGNTSLARDWMTSRIPCTSPGVPANCVAPLKTTLLNHVRGKLTLLRNYAAANGKTIKVVGIYWAQGENDSGAENDAKAYGSTPATATTPRVPGNLEKIMTELRSTIIGVVAGYNPPIVISLVNKNHGGAYTDVVRNAQREYTSYGPSRALRINGDEFGLYDGTHYNFVDLQSLGTKGYDALFRP
jgi:hypothetical protein